MAIAFGHLIAAAFLLTGVALVCVGVAQQDSGWFDIHGYIYPPGYPRIPAFEYKCSAGWRSPTCPINGDDVRLDFCDLPTAVIEDCAAVSDVGKVAVAFSCLAFPLAFFAALAAIARGLGVTDNKTITSAVSTLAGVAALAELIVWTCFLGVVKDNEMQWDWSPAFAWAFAISANFCFAIAPVFLAVDKKED